MEYTWYYLINKAEFEEAGLVSMNLSLVLSGIGLRDILLTQGAYLSVLYDDVFLPINMNDRNPYPFDGHAVYLDESDNIWLGIAIED